MDRSEDQHNLPYTGHPDPLSGPLGRDARAISACLQIFVGGYREAGGHSDESTTTNQDNYLHVLSCPSSCDLAMTGSCILFS